MGFGVWGVGCGGGVWGVGCEVWGVGCGVWGCGVRGLGSGVFVEGRCKATRKMKFKRLGFGVWGVGYRTATSKPRDTGERAAGRLVRRVPRGVGIFL